MVILSKGWKPDNFESHNSSKLSLTNIWGLLSNFVKCESFLEFFCDGLSSFNVTGFYYSYAWSCNLFQGRTSFCTGLISRKFCRFLLMFLTGFISVSVLFLFLYQSGSLSFYTVFDSILSNIDEVLLINSSANVFLVGAFNIHHKDHLTYSSETDRPG